MTHRPRRPSDVLRPHRRRGPPQPARPGRVAGPGAGVLSEARGRWDLTIATDGHRHLLRFPRWALPLSPAGAPSPAESSPGYPALRQSRSALPAGRRPLPGAGLREARNARTAARPLSTCLPWPCGAAPSMPSEPSDVLLAMLRAHIRDHLSDPRLAMAELARRHYVSVRHARHVRPLRRDAGRLSAGTAAAHHPGHARRSAPGRPHGSGPGLRRGHGRAADVRARVPPPVGQDAAVGRRASSESRLPGSPPSEPTRGQAHQANRLPGSSSGYGRLQATHNQQPTPSHSPSDSRPHATHQATADPREVQ